MASNSSYVQRKLIRRGGILPKGFSKLKKNKFYAKRLILSLAVQSSFADILICELGVYVFMCFDVVMATANFY